MNQNAKRRFQAGLSGSAPDQRKAESASAQKSAAERDQERDREFAPAPALAPIGPEGGTIEVSVGAEHAGQRLDRFLTHISQHHAAQSVALSRTRLKHLIEAGALSINGTIITDAGIKLRQGQHISLIIPGAKEAVPQGENIALDIVFEDQHLIIINKPAGLVVHPAAGHDSGTLVNALIAHCGSGLSGIGGVKRPGIVHRLDKDTSGLLVVAKNDQAHQGLSALFADHGRTMDLTRHYLALIWGRPERQHGTIETALGRHPHHREKQAVVAEEKGRHAITHFSVEQSFGTPAHISLINCALETGRTHQIRVHMAHIGCPIIADDLYGAGFRTKAKLLSPAAQSALSALGRQALHAKSLGFSHPITGQALNFEAPLPPDMAAVVKALGNATVL